MSYVDAVSLHITAELAEADVRTLLDQLLPLTVDLGALGEEPGRRFLEIERANSVEFVAGQGLRVRTGARVQWTALGLPVPARLNELELVLRPAIEEEEAGPRLVFRPTIENADFRLLPAAVDRAITARINAALDEEAHLLAWHAGQSLARSIALPANLSPKVAFELGAGAATVEVTDRAIVLRLAVTMRFSRSS